MSMVSKPVKPGKIDFKKISFSTPRAMGTSGAKTLYINYDSKPFSIQSPEMQVAWDIKFYEDTAHPGNGKYQLSLKFNDLSNKKQKDMHNFLDKLDNLLIDTCYENRAAWLKNPKITKDSIGCLYTPLIKRSIDKETGEINGKWPDEFRVKLVKREGEHLFKLFNEKKELIDMTSEDFKIEDYLMRGSSVKGIIRCNGIWIASGKFGCTWKLEQLKVETPEKIKEYAFESSDEEGSDEEEEDDSSSEEEEGESDSDSD